MKIVDRTHIFGDRPGYDVLCGSCGMVLPIETEPGLYFEVQWIDDSKNTHPRPINAQEAFDNGYVSGFIGDGVQYCTECWNDHGYPEILEELSEANKRNCDRCDDRFYEEDLTRHEIWGETTLGGYYEYSVPEHRGTLYICFSCYDYFLEEERNNES